MNYFKKFLKNRNIIIYDENNKNNYDLKNLCVIDNKILNNKKINSYLSRVNKLLKKGDYYSGKVELQTHFINKIKNKNYLLNKLTYLFSMINYRIIPKLPIYSYLPNFIKSDYKILSKAEILGRLVFNGFEIIDYESNNNFFFYLIKKKNEPIKDVSPSYSFIYSMPRVGLNKKVIKVHKFRTMHPYSEFLQEFVFSKYGYKKIGKLNNDFRVTSYGYYFRKYWIDELPQLINFFKGEMNLVGPRPVSEFYFNQLPDDIKKNRVKYKPGCIPPSICFNLNKELKDIHDAERQYFLFMKKKYFFKNMFLTITAIYNIFFKGNRSS